MRKKERGKKKTTENVKVPKIEISNDEEAEKLKRVFKLYNYENASEFKDLGDFLQCF